MNTKVITALELEGQKAFTVKLRTLLQERFGRTPLAHVHSFGCQQNVNDGEKLRGMLREMGCGFTESPEDADIILYNTCAVRENAEQKVLGILGQAAIFLWFRLFRAAAEDTK